MIQRLQPEGQFLMTGHDLKIDVGIREHGKHRPRRKGGRVIAV
jgi:hypothetical protein